MTRLLRGPHHLADEGLWALAGLIAVLNAPGAECAGRCRASSWTKPRLQPPLERHHPRIVCRTAERGRQILEPTVVRRTLRLRLLCGLTADQQPDRTCDKQGRRGADWQFTTADARIKLKSLYPSS